MPRTDFRSPRLFIDAPMHTDNRVPLTRDQAHYLTGVLRKSAGDHLLVFNGRDGEWRAAIGATGKRGADITLLEQTREQGTPGDLHYLFAPLKHARLDYLVQKAVEMGASRLQPVLTRHSQAERVNLARMRANAIEAAEQCGILNLPELGEPLALPALLETLESGRVLIFCDEEAAVKNPVEILVSVKQGADAAMPLAVLIGPEGGFSEEERASILRRQAVRLSLGPRILRADTAAVAALALVQSVLGDWR